MKRTKMHQVHGAKNKIAAGSLIASKAGYAGSLPGCVFLASADIGRAKIGKKSVWITWGRNIAAGTVDALAAKGFRPIWVGADDGSVELVIPDSIVEQLRPILI